MSAERHSSGTAVTGPASSLERCRPVIFALVIFMLAGAVARAEEVVVTLPTRAGVTETFTFDTPARPLAAVILFPGGRGAIGIGGRGGHPVIARADTFLIRSRPRFAASGFAVVALDAPSDHADGLSEAFRKGASHSRDIATVVAWLRQKVAAPVWLVGTSMGSVSAASNAIRLGRAIDGVVLSSPVSASGRNAPELGVTTLDLQDITVPTLVMDHARDACRSSPPANAALIAKRLTRSPRIMVTLIEGGGPPRSGPCRALSYHGYFGVEDRAVAAIVGFITARQPTGRQPTAGR